MDGDEKLRLSRLPEDGPPPALAQVDDSPARLTAKIRIIESKRAPSTSILLTIFYFSLESGRPAPGFSPAECPLVPGMPLSV